MSNSYRRPSIDASYQVSVYLAKLCQSRRFLEIEDFPQMLPTKFQIIWPCGFRGEDFQKQTNQKQESPVVAMFVNGLGQKEQSLQRTFHRCFLPSFGSFGLVVSEEKIFRNRPIRNKNRLWWPCLLMELERYEYSLQRTAHKCFLPSSGSFGQAVPEEKNLKNQPIRNKNCLWWPCLLMDRDGISNLYRGPSILLSFR